MRARLNEWVADSAMAGQAALDEPGRASRMVMFPNVLPQYGAI